MSITVRIEDSEIVSEGIRRFRCVIVAELANGGGVQEVERRTFGVNLEGRSWSQAEIQALIDAEKARVQTAAENVVAIDPEAFS